MSTTTQDSFVWSLEDERKTASFVKERLFILGGMLAYFAGAWEDQPNTPRLIDISRRIQEVRWEIEQYLKDTAPTSEN